MEIILPSVRVRLIVVSCIMFSGLKQLYEFNTDDGGPTGRYLSLRFDALRFPGFVQFFGAPYLVMIGISMTLGGSFYFAFTDILFKHGTTFLITHQVIAIPLLYDFYNYGIGTREFAQLLMHFITNLASLAALLIIRGLENGWIKMKPMNITTKSEEALKE